MKNKNILVAIIINVFITISEVAVGLFIGSLALISDAVHNFSDVGALGLSWWGEKEILTSRPLAIDKLEC
ncbi:MAG: Cation diffusion facilitator family transporter [Candidatus Moranbacteria bacterium GW2011_GWD2_36_12]|nr:MAG: Cation diffusion facilitator family transporter [Candidatus Moranbacteria bacterium GW2011_GWD2_36_12]KKQ06988.1 MAG: Cation diffusion facilitator family transporter [Candidatus Moranbacteria bacterium GW2011_GWE2_36_40]